MKHLLSVLSFFALFLFGLFVTTPAFADTFTLSGNVSDSTGTDVENVTIEVVDPSNSSVVASTSTNSEGNYTTIISGGVYDITATPPPASGFQDSTVTNQNISSNTVLNFTLAPVVAQVLISGQVTDRNGDGLANVSVRLTNTETSLNYREFTNETGDYVIAAPPGTYVLNLDKSGIPTLIPSVRATTLSTISVTENMTLDVEIPSVLATVVVKDPEDNPVANVGVRITTTGENVSMDTSLGSLQFHIDESNSTSDNTDVIGTTLVATFPGTGTILVEPPSGSVFGTKSFTQTITQDTTIPVTLQVENVLVNGQVTDRNGDGLANVSVRLTNTETSLNYREFTNETGDYVIAAPPGTYVLNLDRSGIPTVIPSVRATILSTISVTENMTLDVEIPSVLATVVVKDPEDNPVANVGVRITTTGENVSMDTSLGSLQFHIDESNSTSDNTDVIGTTLVATFPGTGTILVEPPSGSLFVPQTFTQVITQDTTIPVTLEEGNVLFSGQVTNRDGDGIGDLSVRLVNVDNSSTYREFTNQTGVYTVAVPPGTYKVELDGSATNLTPSLRVTSLNTVSITENTSLDIEVPSALVTFVVQDPEGNPVEDADVRITTTGSEVYMETSLGTFQFHINESNSTTEKTDETGTAVVGTFPTIGSILVEPPSGSLYSSVTINNVSITDDETRIISLQFAVTPTPTPTNTPTLTPTSTPTPTNTPTPTPVANVAPVVGAITASVNPVQVMTVTGATANFTDANTSDTHTAVYDWGDGMTSLGDVTGSNGSGSVSGSHVYLAAGVYEITLTVTDNSNASDSEIYQYISVYNPTPQGLFTGVRKFNSPANAYPANTSLTGQVEFGITAKYHNGSINGDVEMSFDAANFEFNSTSLTVFVTANGKATLRGTGTVNGAGNYTFLVTGLDGGSGNADDFVRYQIKNGSTVVYDSQPGAPDTNDPNTLVTVGNVTVN